MALSVADMMQRIRQAWQRPADRRTIERESIGLASLAADMTLVETAMVQRGLEQLYGLLPGDVSQFAIQRLIAQRWREQLIAHERARKAAAQ